jgi:Tol biopolymer transport system component
MRFHGTGPVVAFALALLAAIWLALAAATPVQAASIQNAILAGGFAKPVLINPSTGKVRKLPAFKAARDETALRTMDGRALITAYDRAGATWVERYSLANGKVTVIGPFPITGSQTIPYALSPDGRQLVTRTMNWSTVPGTSTGSDGPIRVDRLNLDTVTSTPLIGPIPSKPRGFSGDTQTEWFAGFGFSRDGRQLAYIHRHKWMVTGSPAGDVPFLRLMVMAPDGSGAHKLADLANEGSDVAWAPDSRRIAAGTTSGLRIIDLNAPTPPVKVTSGLTDGASFSRSGRYLAYVALNAMGQGKLRIRDLKTRKTVTPKLGFAGALSWAPKRDELAVCAGRKLYRVSAKGRAKKLSSKYCLPVWGPTPGA